MPAPHTRQALLLHCLVLRAFRTSVDERRSLDRLAHEVLDVLVLEVPCPAARPAKRARTLVLSMAVRAMSWGALQLNRCQGRVQFAYLRVIIRALDLRVQAL